MSNEDAIAIIKRAEAELQQLLSLAAARGDYDSVGEITRLAKQLNELCSTPTPFSDRPSDQSNSAGRRRKTRRRRAGRQTEYPKFLRRGDDLVKIAWSKNEHAEYQHKAPKHVVDLLVTRILAQARPGELFRTDDILPLRDGSDEEIPSYQCYVALAWLRTEGLVEKVGRSGYAIVSDVELGEIADVRWDDLKNGLT